MSQAPVTKRARRADAQRNYDQILKTAREAVAQRGPDIVLEDIARDAGVGIGTLYRHFPTRQELLEVAFLDEVLELRDRAVDLSDKQRAAIQSAAATRSRAGQFHCRVRAGRGEACGDVADPAAGDHFALVVAHRDVVMGCGPIDSAIQTQRVLTPSIRCRAVTGGLTRRPNRGTQRSVISLAVRDSSAPQDIVLSKSSRLGNNHREVNPAAGSGNGIAPPPTEFRCQARRSFVRRRTPGHIRHHLATELVRNKPPVTRTGHLLLLND